MTEVIQEYRPATLDEVKDLYRQAKARFEKEEIRQHPHVPAGLTNSTSEEVYAELLKILER